MFVLSGLSVWNDANYGTFAFSFEPIKIDKLLNKLTYKMQAKNVPPVSETNGGCNEMCGGINENLVCYFVLRKNNFLT